MSLAKAALRALDNTKHGIVARHKQLYIQQRHLHPYLPLISANIDSTVDNCAMCMHSKEKNIAVTHELRMT